MLNSAGKKSMPDVVSPETYILHFFINTVKLKLYIHSAL